MKNIRNFLLFTFLLSAILALQVNAQLLVEDFDFTGNLTANGWTAHSGAGTNPIATTTGLSYTGYAGSGIGNAVLLQNLGGEDVNRGFTEQNVNGTSIYFSALVNVNETSSSRSGDYFLHIGDRVSGTSFTSFSARVFVRISSDVVNFGISNTTSTYGTTSFAKNTTYLLIVKYTINTGGSDEVKLWVLPSGIPANEIAAGTPEVTNSSTSGQDVIDAVGIRQGSGTTSVQLVLDAIRIGTAWTDLFPASGSAILTASPTSLSGFEYAPGSGPSASQSYNLTGSSLSPASGDITVTGSTNYEVSLNDLTFSGSVNIGYTGGALASTPVYVRLKAGLVGGVYNGELIENDGGGATTNVTCNGAVVVGEPTNHVTSFTGVLGNPGYYFNNLSWVDASGGTAPDGYLIKSSDVDFASIVDPVDGVPESNSFRVQNVTQGLQSAVFTGFAGTTYYYKIFPYSNSGSNIDYKTDGSVPQFSIVNDNAPSLPLTENFPYTTGSNLTDNGWVAHSAAGFLPLQVNASPLTYNGYINSGIGKSVSLVNSLGAPAEDVNKLFSSVSSGSMYASFMVNVSSATTDGIYFFHFGPENSTTSFFGKVFVQNDGSNNLAFGVAKNSNTLAAYTPFSYSLNTTYLVVVKYTFNTSSTNDDEVKLWINPVLDGSEPVADLTQTDTQTDPTKLDFIALRQAITNNNGPALTIGGIRVATSWVPVIPTTFSTAFTVAANWNLVSFPGFHPNSMSPDTLFRGRDITASLFKFDGGSYQAVNTVTPAEGYWLKMSANRAYNWNGTVQGGILYPQLQFANVETINANAGWNLIGVYEYQIDPLAITTIPSGLITGPIFKYNAGIGYGITSVLDRGQAYWVFMDAAGTISLPPRGTVLEKLDAKDFIEKSWSKITITDAEGFSTFLYADKGSSNGLRLLLPPLPPAGVPDVRFSSNRLVEDISSEKVIQLNSLAYPIKIRVEGIDVIVQSSVNEFIDEDILKNGSEMIINNHLTKLTIRSTGLIPAEFTLEQNYPNPFNPSTKIRFDLPQQNFVTITVYNMLGEEVAILINENLMAGRHEIDFNAKGLSSGVYIYKITAGQFVQSKKMTLIK